MRRLEILNTEENRIDKILIRAYGNYDWARIAVLKHFNPTLDLLWLIPGTLIMIPNEAEIAEIRNYRAYYTLIRG